MPPHRPIALVGLSGAGKSSIGRALAAHLGWPLLDTDALVVRAAGRDVAQIFAAEGEARFREREAAALCQALESPLAVIATGAGVVLRAENRALLRERALVAWLDAPTAALIARLRAHDEARPLLQGDDPAARLEALRAARAALYAEVANIRIATDERSVEHICQELLALVGEFER
jgi:shikimate kinase